MNPTPRYDFLDWLRVIAIFVLIFFHTGMLFVGWGWHITNDQTIPALVWPMDLSHRLRMPLLFVIAGAGMWFALQRRSGKAFAGERTVRLLVPALIGMFLIVPPQIFIERISHGEWHGGYLDFFTQRVLQFQPYPAGNFSWHHLWFIVYLYVYVLLLLPLMLWWRRAKPALEPGLWIALLALPLGLDEALLKPIFGETHDLLHDGYLFTYYLLFTLYGFVLASSPSAWDWLAKVRRATFVFALSFTIALLALFAAGILEHGSTADALLANVFTWAWLMVFLGFGRQYLGFSNRLLRWARDASYPIYILHQTVILVIAYFVIREPWAPWTKFWIVALSTLVVCVVMFEFLLRRVAVLRLAFGIRQPKEAAVGARAAVPVQSA
jgi:peptidoglycan/LPS O-acetylase OafA/YrhL